MPRRYGALGATRVDLATAIESQYAAPSRIVGPLRATLPVQADQAFTSITVSSFIALSDGSATAPALRYQNDAQTGLFRPGVGMFAWTIQGVERMRIGNSGLHVGSTYTAPPSGGIRSEGGIVVETGGIQSNQSNAFYRDVDADSLAVFGGTVSAQGARLTLYGSTQVTAANDIEFKADALVRLLWDNSATIWNFQSLAVSMGALTATTVSSSGEIRHTGGANTTPFTQTRITVYRDASNWGYLAYGDDANFRLVFSATAQNHDLLFGTSSNFDGTGTFTELARLTNAALKPATAGGLTLGTAAGLYWSETYTRIIDTAGAADLLLKRSAVTKLTLASASATFVDPVRIPDGTVSLPSLAFSGATNSGLYRTGTFDIEIAINGTKTAKFRAAGMEFHAATGRELGRFEDTTTAGQVALKVYDVDNNLLEQVTVGAADSGGVGFKVLRIPN